MQSYFLISLVFVIQRLRKLHRKFLQKFLIFRLLKLLILRVYFRYPIFFKKIFYLPTVRAKTFEFIKVSEFIKKRRFFSITIRESSINTIPGPRFVGRYPVEQTLPEVCLIEPPIVILEAKKVRVMGGTNLLLDENFAVHPDLQIPERDVIPAEYLGFAKVDKLCERIRLGITKKNIHVTEAISLLGNCTGNYAHWLTEILPKLILINEHKQYLGVPILVDDWIHPTILSTIDFFNKNGRSIIYVPRWQSIYVEKLIDLSPPAYTPPESRFYYDTNELPPPLSDYFIFSKFALNRLRHAAWEVTAKTQSSIKNKRLYLKRALNSTGNGRLITNSDEVDSLIESYGFTSVSTIDMSFEEQIALFKQAEYIVSPIGAALINTLFSPQGCKVICLSPYYEKANYFYFSNFMGVLGHETHYVIGPQVDTENIVDHILHKNYLIELNALEAALKRLTQ